MRRTDSVSVCSDSELERFLDHLRCQCTERFLQLINKTTSTGRNGNSSRASVRIPRAKATVCFMSCSRKILSNTRPRPDDWNLGSESEISEKQNKLCHFNELPALLELRAWKFHCKCTKYIENGEREAIESTAPCVSLVEAAERKDWSRQRHCFSGNGVK